MIFRTLRRGARAFLLLIPPIRRYCENFESLGHEFRELDRKLGETQGRLQEAERRNEVAERQLSEQGMRLQEAERRNGAAKLQIAELEEQLQEAGSRNALIPELERQLSEQEMRLQEAAHRNGAAEQQVAVLTERLREAEGRNDLIPEMQSQLAEKAVELDVLRSSVAELERTVGGMRARLGEIAPLEERLAALQGVGARNREDDGRRGLTIGMFGNINNYPFLLAEGFRKLGHEVRLAVNRKYILHRPESMFPEWSGNYPDWVLDCSALSEEDVLSSAAPVFERVVSEFFGGVDLMVLNDYGPALAGRLPRPQVALLTGSDLTYYSSFRSLDLRTGSWDPEYKRSPEGRTQIRKYADAVARQREGILAAEVVSFGARGLIPDGDELLDSIGVADARRMMILLSDTIGLQACAPVDNEKLRIFNGARVVWRQSPEGQFSQQDMKGTDVLLEGFAMYCRSGGRGELRMVRKGQDLEQAYVLCRDLGIEDRVIWLDEMDLHRFEDEMRSADLVCDQLAGSFPGMVTSHAYALGRPVLANLRNECFSRVMPEPLPGFQASTAEEVMKQLLRLDADREAARRMGAQSRQYAERYMSPESMAEQVLRRVGLV